VNYCYFIVPVQIEPKLTIGAQLPYLIMECRRTILSLYSYLYHYNCVSVIGCLHKQLRERERESLMYLAHFYTITVNTPSYPRKLFDCGQSDHMKTYI